MLLPFFPSPILLHPRRAQPPSATISLSQPQQKQSPEASLPAYQPTRRPRARRQPAPAFPIHRFPLIAASLTSGALTLYVILLYTGFRRDIDHSDKIRDSLPSDPSARYTHTATKFDDDVGTMEWVTGINRRRRELVANAKGHILENAVGTCRNSGYYPLMDGKVKSITMVDKSREMIDVAREKWANGGTSWFGYVRFYVADARPGGGDANYGIRGLTEVPGPQKGLQERWDTVVQTMGVCSTGDPVGMLRELGECCRRPEENVAWETGARRWDYTQNRPTRWAGEKSRKEMERRAKEEEEGGRILLLEHGRSHYNWLNRLLDSTAPSHAERHGCWWNRDVGEIVRDSGLEIIEEKRFHLGTTWWYVLKVPKGWGNREERVVTGLGARGIGGGGGGGSEEKEGKASGSQILTRSWWSWISGSKT